MDEKFKLIIKKIFSGINKIRLIIINLVFFYFLFLFFDVAAVSTEKTKIPEVRPDSVLLVQPVGIITEKPTNKSFSEKLISHRVPCTTLSSITESIVAASYDRRIKALLFDFSQILSLSPSFAYEIKAAIDEFLASGKPYYAFDTYYNLTSYFLASAADQLCIDPFGSADFSGFSYEGVFLGGMPEKTGIKFAVTKAGTYKGAADTYTETAFTPEVKENYKSLLGDFWSYYVKSCAENRKLEKQVFLDYAENPTEILKAAKGNNAQALLNTKLVTDISVFSDFLESINIDEESLMHFEDFHKTVKHPESKNSIYIIDLEGAIVSGSENFDYEVVAASSDLAYKFEKAIYDPSTKGIVLRIDSGGGEVFASEIIRRCVENAKTKYGIPVVVSMSNAAASGAYWIASSADYIFANPFTLTGSIGVLATQPNIGDALAKHLGISTDLIYAGAKPLSIFKYPREEDMEIVQMEISNIYDNFLQIVSNGRNMPKRKVAEIASGKVYTGAQALQIGLVDKLGTFNDAIKYTAELCGVEGDYKIRTIIPEKTLLDNLLDFATEQQVSISQLPLLNSLLEFTQLSKKNSYLLYEPFKICTH